MKFEFTKKGQGVLARLAAYGVGSVLVVFGAIRFFATFNTRGQGVLVRDVPILGELTVYNVVAIMIAVVGLLALHLVLNRDRSVDLLIETEQEMKKVSWPTPPEVWNATLVVVLVTAVLAFTMFGFDVVLGRLFRLVF
jgi:preprotein translocase SecE subunit